MIERPVARRTDLLVCLQGVANDGYFLPGMRLCPMLSAGGTELKSQDPRMISRYVRRSSKRTPRPRSSFMASSHQTTSTSYLRCQCSMFVSALKRLLTGTGRFFARLNVSQVACDKMVPNILSSVMCLSSIRCSIHQLPPSSAVHSCSPLVRGACLLSRTTLSLPQSVPLHRDITGRSPRSIPLPCILQSTPQQML